MISKSTTVSTGECKCGVLEVHFKLKDQQQVVLLIYRLQYQNLMVTTIWKFTHTKKKKETKHKSKISYQITREENKSGREEKRTKINPKQLTKWQSDQISQSLSHVQLFATPWIAARQASLSITTSRSSLRLTSIESVMPSSHLILCRPLLLLPPIAPSIRVFSNESTLRMRWPKYWSFSFSIIAPKEIPGLISFRMDWLDLLAVQGTLKSLLQHHSSKASEHRYW